MGSQRYIAEGLMEKYLLTQDQAYDRARIVQQCQLGDDIDDALYYLYETVEPPEKALAVLRGTRDRLSEKISELAALDWPIRR